MSALVVRGWVGPGTLRLDLAVPAGECAEAAVAAPGAVLRRVAGLERPLLWIRLGERQLGRCPAAERARAGLATVDGALPRLTELTVLDLLLAGRPLPGRLGFLGGGTEERRRLAAEREAQARALAGQFGLGPFLDEPLAALEEPVAAVADAARALLAEPRAVVAALPADAEAAAWMRSRLAAEAGRRDVPVLLLRAAAPG